jgi:hypothetical protein
MGKDEFVLIFVEPAMECGYLVWPLPTDRPTLVGLADVPGEHLCHMLQVRTRI